MKAIVTAAFTHWRTVLALMFLMFFLGGYAYVVIPRETLPNVARPVVSVVDILNGLSPQDAEDLLAKPLQEQIRTLTGINKITSSSFQGGVFLQVEFTQGVSPETALQEVQQQINIAQAKLPSGAMLPIVSESSTSNIPVLSVVLHGNVPFRELMGAARLLKRNIGSLPSILAVSMAGGRDDRVNLMFNPVTMENYHISPVFLLQKIQRGNQFIPAGSQQNKAGAFTLDVPSLYREAKDILDVPILTYKRNIVRVRDIAKVVTTYDRQTIFNNYNGRTAIALSVTKRARTNLITVTNRIKSVVREAKKTFPENLKVEFTGDTSKNVVNNLRDMQNSLLLSIIIVMIIVVASLGLRDGILIGISIPGSFLAAMLVVYILGITLNIVVLFAFILAGGMLVDTTIVVIEYASKQLDRGFNSVEAFRASAVRMAWPVISSTLTTLAAFVPLLFWPGVVGEFIRDLPITVVSLLIASTFMSLIFVPVLGAYARAAVRFLIVFLMGVGATMFVHLVLNAMELPHGQKILWGVAITAGLVVAFIVGLMTRGLSMAPAKKKSLCGL